PVFWPLLMFVRSGACLRSGRPAEGVSLIEEAIEVAGVGSELTLLPAFYLLKGELLLALTEPNGSGADSWLLRAFDGAQELDARMLQLQAATVLCRSRRDPLDREAAMRRLSAVYSTFTEGFAAPDLVEARNLLASLPV